MASNVFSGKGHFALFGPKLSNELDISGQGCPASESNRTKEIQFPESRQRLCVTTSEYKERRVSRWKTYALLNRDKSLSLLRPSVCTNELNHRFND